MKDRPMKRNEYGYTLFGRFMFWRSTEFHIRRCDLYILRFSILGNGFTIPDIWIQLFKYIQVLFMVARRGFTLKLSFWKYTKLFKLALRYTDKEEW